MRRETSPKTQMTMKTTNKPKKKVDHNLAEGEAKSEQSAPSETKTKVGTGGVSVSTKGGTNVMGNMGTSYPMMKANAKSSLTVQADQHLYKPGDR